MRLTTTQKIDFKKALARAKVVKYECDTLLKKLALGSEEAELIRRKAILQRAQSNFVRVGFCPLKKEIYMNNKEQELIINNAEVIYEDLFMSFTWDADDIRAVAETLEVEAPNGAPCPVLLSSEDIKKIIKDIEREQPKSLKDVEKIILNVYAISSQERREGVV